ncbi:MAG TPA: hypothetical protein VFP00_01585 [Burkholderiales bacterium]|nr:hypothetical protein [Burkholderiales bacterium]
MKIVAVTHARGVEFLFDGAKDKNGNPCTIRVEQLKQRGVQFVMRSDGAPWRAGRRCAKMAVAFFPRFFPTAFRPPACRRQSAKTITKI